MIRISITGPESTGKSWLAERLAAHYNTLWVPEYARAYLLKIQRPYTYDELLVIAQNQLRNEDRAARQTGLLFCDTDFCVTSIWCNVKYGKCHQRLTENLEKHRYNLYLLCDIDLPWEYDPLREHPDMRTALFDMYRQLLDSYNFPYQVVSGSGEARLQNAIAFIDEYLNTSL